MENRGLKGREEFEAASPSERLELCKKKLEWFLDWCESDQEALTWKYYYIASITERLYQFPFPLLFMMESMMYDVSGGGRGTLLNEPYLINTVSEFMRACDDGWAKSCSMGDREPVGAE